MKNIISCTSLIILIITLCSCQQPPLANLKEALTFYVSFDNGVKADFALGDKNIYTADSRSKIDSSRVGMHNTDYRIIKDSGHVGDAFEFGKKTDQLIFYKSKDNISYSPQNWEGTISFWLSLDPATDLEAVYNDPIQITDTRFNDASIWVDFTDKDPRDFRLGLFGDQDQWTLDTLHASPKDVFEKRLVTVKSAPFARGSWTHVLITYEALGTPQSIGSLYLNGNKMGDVSGIDDPFTWDLEQSKIFLGLSYIGLMDELSIFNKPLTTEQVKELYQLEGGVKSIL